MNENSRAAGSHRIAPNTTRQNLPLKKGTGSLESQVYNMSQYMAARCFKKHFWDLANSPRPSTDDNQNNDAYETYV